MSINIGNDKSTLTIYKDEQGKFKTYIKGTETQEDGSIKIPKALQPYMGGKEVIKAD